MPNCFQLLCDGQPVVLVDVDAEMCRHFNVECDLKQWHCYWYDFIGSDLAAGRTLDQIIAAYPTELPEFPELVLIAEWLKANFTTRAWYESSSLPRER